VFIFIAQKMLITELVFFLAGLFAFAGFYQMAIWAIGKHRAYKKDFKDYPRGRKAIIPFVL
jgi:very-long-chain enoyl-CoA reductase